jgi:endoglycosylceramidase
VGAGAAPPLGEGLQFPGAPFGVYHRRVANLFLRGTALLPSILGALASPSCGGSDPQAPAPSEDVIEAPKLTSRRLVTRGRALVDEIGRTVILRGVNVGGRSKMPPFMPFELDAMTDVAEKAASLMSAVRHLGANGIRLTLSWEALETTKGSFDSVYMNRYRALLDAADGAGIAVIIDFHQDVFHAAFCGDGFPEWALGDIAHGAPHYDCGNLAWSAPYFDATSTVNGAFDGLWSNRDGLLDAFVGMWAKVAREFGRHPAVAAFEVINEPGQGSQGPEVAGSTILPPIYDRVASAIEAEAGPAAVLGDEPIATTNEHRLGRPNHARFTYSPHFYDILTILGGMVEVDRIRDEVTAILERSEALGAPVILSEFGAPNSNAQKAEFTSAVLDAADVRRASAMAWEASVSDVSWNHEDFSVFTSDGAERVWGAALDRPFPQAIDGTVIDLGWDATTKRFRLLVEGNGDKVSEVYLPVGKLGTMPKITLTGARSRWIKESGKLLVHAERGATWSLLAEEAP